MTVLKRGPFTASGTLARLESRPASAVQATPRMDERSPYSGTGLPQAIQSYVFGESETLSAGVPINTWYFDGINQAGEIFTTVNHGLWQTGTTEGFDVSGTGGLFDTNGPYVDLQLGGTTIQTLVPPIVIQDNGTGGLVVPTLRRLSAWGTAYQSVIAKMPRDGGTHWDFDGVDDELTDSFSIITAATGWCRIYIYKVPAAQTGYRFLYAKQSTIAHPSFSSTTLGQRDYFQFSNDAGTGYISFVTTGWSAITPGSNWNVLAVWGNNTVRHYTSNGGSRYGTAASSVGALVPASLGGVLGSGTPLYGRMGLARVITLPMPTSIAQLNAMVAYELSKVGGNNNWIDIPA